MKTALSLIALSALFSCTIWMHANDYYYERISAKDTEAGLVETTDQEDPKDSGSSYFWSSKNDDKDTTRKKCTRRRWLGAGLALWAALSFSGDGMSIGGSQAIKNQLSPITAHPYEWVDHKMKAPNIMHKADCTYEDYFSGYEPQSARPYIRGDALCIRGLGCKAIIETCQGADEYIESYNTGLAGQIIALITKAPAMGGMLISGVKLLIRP